MHQRRINLPSKEEVGNIFRKFGVDEQEAGGNMEIEVGTRPVDVSKLHPHPKNTEIYGEEDVSDLAVQIEAYGGIADPLKIKEDFTIISGHRRWQAARELGMTEVPCQFVSYDSEEEELAALVMFNYHRAKTNEQKAREGMVLERALKAEGMERKLKTLKQHQSDRDLGSLSVTSEEIGDSSSEADASDKKGRTRDLVADAVKIGSGKNFERMKKVIVAADKLKEEGKPDDAAFLLRVLEGSVKPACNLLDAGYISLPDEERERIRSGDVPLKQFLAERLNKPTSKVSFKRMMKSLSTVGQVLSDAAQTIDALNEDEMAELMETLDTVKAALTKVATTVQQSYPKDYKSA